MVGSHRPLKLHYCFKAGQSPMPAPWPKQGATDKPIYLKVVRGAADASHIHGRKGVQSAPYPRR